MILATNVIAVSGDSVNDDTIRFAPLLYTPKNEDTFHFEPEAVNVNVSEINPDNVIKAVEISGYVLGLNDTLKKHKDRLVPGGFEMPDNDEENACLITKLPNGSYKISVNTGYKNKSHLALTMMMAYELNLFFSNEEKGHIDHFDKLRGCSLLVNY